MTGVVISAATAALIVTKLTDFLRNTFDKGGTAPPWVWNAVSFGLGALLAVIFEIDYANALLNQPDAALADLVGVPTQILTGLGLGALASAWHEFLDFLSSAAKQYRSTSTQV